MCNVPAVKVMPKEGERKLCLFHGEWIVLEVNLETPTHEETFSPFLYWREPFSDTLCIETNDVLRWVDLPIITTEEYAMNDEDFSKMVLRATEKLYTQNKQSLKIGDGRDNSDYDCAYRGVGGTSCPIGFMMDDETARVADLQKDSAVNSIIKAGIWGNELNKDQVDCLVLLQRAHDSSSAKNKFKKHFINNLRENGLYWISEHIEGIRL
jgi:hypothetical protein